MKILLVLFLSINNYAKSQNLFLRTEVVTKSDGKNISDVFYIELKDTLNKNLLLIISDSSFIRKINDFENRLYFHEDLSGIIGNKESFASVINDEFPKLQYVISPNVTISYSISNGFVHFEKHKFYQNIEIPIFKLNNNKLSISYKEVNNLSLIH